MTRTRKNFYKQNERTQDSEKVIFLERGKLLISRYWEDREKLYFFANRPSPRGHLKSTISPPPHKEEAPGFRSYQWILVNNKGIPCGWYELQIKDATFSYGNLLGVVTHTELAQESFETMLDFCFKTFGLDYLQLFFDKASSIGLQIAQQPGVERAQAWSPSNTGLSEGHPIHFWKISHRDWEETKNGAEAPS